ncbi:nitroreductase family deazaflavin-dependent oxidoreductase [Pseudonocardia acidicola]|uniref:Nitroreductase family deazaflavin-dependent oxidoreductase n=1 Tax=Pseudonocardia acidicola TaxID=2724939 RepID=A0ABX1SCP9_9PSEU|nr:nitroreductase family deazaflavin-dependent oxidoreductase [Pseudonocardia acidicola]NMH98865.1 nitroreductase family deazaflavin-dependent oxidoreductase [Pseudonocardia acidicola]
MSEPQGEPVDSPVGWVNEHIKQYDESGGTEGHEWNGVPTLLLTVTGRRTGTPRRTALIYGEDDGNYVIVASKGGAPDHPVWYLNLQADPDVEIQVGPQKLAAKARTADADEKARLWPKMAEIWPAYDEYATKTDRDIPVVILEPQR